MRKISAKGNFDKKYLMACLALAGYKADYRGLIEILKPIGKQTVKNKLVNGDFRRDEMMKIAIDTKMDMYDFIRVFFTDLLRLEQTRVYELRKALTSLLIEERIETEEDTEGD